MLLGSLRCLNCVDTISRVKVFLLVVDLLVQCHINLVSRLFVLWWRPVLVQELKQIDHSLWLPICFQSTEAKHDARLTVLEVWRIFLDVQHFESHKVNLSFNWQVLEDKLESLVTAVVRDFQRADTRFHLQLLVTLVHFEVNLFKLSLELPLCRR